jgi:hypothetical protein
MLRNRIGWTKGRRPRFRAAGALLGVMLLQLVAAPARAADTIPPGTVIDKQN